MGSGGSKSKRGSKASLKRRKRQSSSKKSKQDSQTSKAVATSPTPTAGQDEPVLDSVLAPPVNAIGMQEKVQQQTTGIAQRAALDIYAHPSKK